ncbi:MAG: TonB-dependent receptor [Alistipes sp.]|nr:TonB-dependent receptor [Alistipes sp.]
MGNLNKLFCYAARRKARPPESSLSLAAAALLLLTAGIHSAAALPGPAELHESVMQAAQRRITGAVVDDAGNPVIGANVILVGGGNVGTSTDGQGRFTLTVPAEAMIRVSSLGYTTLDIRIDERNEYILTLSEDSQSIEDVVVVGYGTQKKESVVGAISQVKGSDLVLSGSSNITSAMAGKLSGVTTIQRSGQPGSDDAEITIRGLSSFNSPSPLVLVDGIERDFKSIDPNEVSSISVLKDASATAVFGAKGANGVIIVTTRRGVEGKPKMDVSASVGFQKPINVAKHIDAYTTMSMMNVAKMNDQLFSDLTSQRELAEYANPSSRINSILYPDVDWFRETTEPFAPTVNANFNISGGTKFVKYFASLGYTHQGSIFKSRKDGKLDNSFYYNRFNYRTNLDFNLTRSTVLAFNFGGDLQIQNSPSVYGGDLWKYMFRASSTKYPLYYPAWVMEEIPDIDYPGLYENRYTDGPDQDVGNPYFQLIRGNFNQYTSNKLFTDIQLRQQLDFITPGLSFAAKFSLSTYYQYNTLKTERSIASYELQTGLIGSDINPWVRSSGSATDVYYPEPWYTETGGINSNYYQDFYYDFSLNYDNSFGRHNVTGLALMNLQQQNKGSDFAYYNAALVGRATYDYAHRYLVEVNIGYTGSERFAPGNRFGFFPSGAIGWVVSEEPFFKRNVRWMSRLKFRYSDGLVGSDYAGSRWLYVSEFSLTSEGYAKEDAIANSYVQWERARKRDLGVELGFLKNALTVSVDFFDEKRDKMLISVANSVPMFVGNSFKELNRGEIKKHGMEVELDFYHTLPNGLNFYVRGNIGLNENRIVVQDDAPYSLSHQKNAGTALGAQKKGTYLFGEGYFTSIDDLHIALGQMSDIGGLVVGDYKFLDYYADGILNSDDVTRLKGTTQPPVSYGFGGGFNWKGFDFNFLFQGYAGKYINYDMLYEYEFFKGNYRIHQSSLNYWSPSNPDGTHAALHYSNGRLPYLTWSNVYGEANDSGGGYGKIPGKSWRRADFLRLKELSIGYTINSRKLESLMGIRGLKVYVPANNLLTFTSLLEGDPENTYLINGNYPQMMTVKAGIQIAF